MHYRNGREAKPGDRVINLDGGHIGLIHSINSGSTTCNARLAVTSQNDPYVNLKDCVHIDDLNSVFPLTK